MSHLKILVCTLLLAVTSATASSSRADHRLSATQGYGCGRTDGNPTPYGEYGQLGQSYRLPNRMNYDAYQSPLDHRHGVPQGFNSRYETRGYSGDSGFRTQYGSGRGFDQGYDRRDTLERSFYESGNRDIHRNVDSIYDSVHGDYHAVPRGASRHSVDPYRSGAPSSYYGRGFIVNSGW